MILNIKPWIMSNCGDVINKETETLKFRFL